MRSSRALASVLVPCALAACAPVAAPVPSPSPVHAPVRAPAYRAELLTLGKQLRSPFFAPDGRVYLPYGEHVLVADPGDLEHGEIVPFRGALYPRAGRLFARVTNGEDDEGGGRFAELDWQLHEVRHLAIPEGIAQLALTPNGAFATVIAYARKAGAGPVRSTGALYRTSDMSLVLSGVEGRWQVPGRLATLGMSPDERFVVSGQQVIDTKEAKVVFSHGSLGASTLLFEGPRLHWLFRDLLETVELGSGKRSQTWLPCRGPSESDPQRTVIFTACAKGLVRTSFASGAPSSTVVPYPPGFEAEGLRVEESGRVVVSRSAPDPKNAQGAAAVVPALALAPGGVALEPAAPVVAVAGRPHVEPGSPGQPCRVVLADGRPMPMHGVSCEALVSPNGRFLVSPAFGTVEVLALPDGKPVGRIGAPHELAFNGTVRVDDGELLATSSAAGHEVQARIRLRPSESPSSEQRVRMVRPTQDKAVDVLVDRDTVVLETADGKPITQFPFEPYYFGKAMLAGGEIVVYSERPDVAFGDPYHCKRDGRCSRILQGGPVFAFVGSEALGARYVAGTSAFVRVDLRSGTEVAIPTPKEVTSAAAVSDGWVVGLSGGQLAHVSRATGAVDRVSEGAVGSGLPIVGAAFDRVALARFGPDVVLVDSTSFAVTDHYILGQKGHLHVDRTGRYTTSGDAADLESFVLCSDGHHLAPRASCRLGAAPR